jgi:hypothetical protein
LTTVRRGMMPRTNKGGSAPTLNTLSMWPIKTVKTSVGPNWGRWHCVRYA